MELIEYNRSLKCDFGLCSNVANYIIKFPRMCSGNHFYICKDCLEELCGKYETIKKEKNESITACDNLKKTDSKQGKKTKKLKSKRKNGNIIG